MMGMVGIVLLAAGSSTRMRQPKQLLPWKNTTLLRHMAATACAVADAKVVVVLGSDVEKCRETLQDLTLNIAVNAHWQEGMGGSIACGVSALLDLYGHLEAILVMLCDQVAVDGPLLQELIRVHADYQPDVVFCDYGDDKGPPALFSERMFGELLLLKGPGGAKKLWEKTHNKMTLTFPRGVHDLDTSEQYTHYLSNHP